MQWTVSNIPTLLSLIGLSLCFFSAAVRLRTKDSDLGPAAGILGVALFLLAISMYLSGAVIILENIRSLLTQR